VAKLINAETMVSTIGVPSGAGNGKRLLDQMRDVMRLKHIVSGRSKRIPTG
jgi:hypothetical protein